MPNDSLETRIKLRIHSAIGTYIVAHKLTRQELSRRMREEWKKGRWDKLKAGPLQYPHGIDKLQWVAEKLGFEVQDDGTCVPAGPMQLPQRHAVPLAA
jgi:hypothetical protein